MKKTKKGAFSLIELMVVVVMLSVLVASVMLVFRAILLASASQQIRAGVSIDSDWLIEKMVRDLREAREMSSASGYNEIRFSPDGSNYSIYYLYNAADSYVPPPAFDQDSYQIKKATLTGGINGTFTYGAGTLVAFDCLAPPATNLSAAGNIATIDISIKRGDETIRSLSRVMPRNL
ncbi:MAG: prepilin-type N-terminal cleavage/methylation domain-containing protein [Candidatus Omnitrophota bacterium]